MNVLIIGGGGREHALAWKTAQSPLVDRVFCAPGNPGVERLPKGKCVPIAVKDFAAIDLFSHENKIDLVIVGPEDPLAAGIVDSLSKCGHTVFGPCAAAARLEASKSFAKAFMQRHGIPSADYAEFSDPDEAVAYVRQKGAPIVVKADGLAAGKGVAVCSDVDSAVKAIRDSMVGGVFGEAGARVVIEECLVGEEASILALCDGDIAVALPSSQDHKRVDDGDQGPNTGGMGAYSPAPVITPELAREIQDKVLTPCVQGMAEEGSPYKGILYAGLMITKSGPKVIEFNVRFGDPETQVVLPRMRSDIVPALVACCEGRLESVEIAYEAGSCVTVVMASGGYPGPYEKGFPITGLNAAESDPDVLVFHAGTAIRENQVVTNGGRVLNVTARAEGIGPAIAKAYEAAGKVSFQAAHYRKDIGQRALDRLRGRS